MSTRFAVQSTFMNSTGDDWSPDLSLVLTPTLGSYKARHGATLVRELIVCLILKSIPCTCTKHCSADRDASSCDSLLAVRIPLLALHAQDDPVIGRLRAHESPAKGNKIAVAEAVPYQEFQQAPYAVLCMTKLGGHLGWFESGGGRWFAKAVGSSSLPARAPQ